MLHGRKEMAGGSQRSGSSPVGGVVAKPDYRTRAGDPGANSIGQRGGREHSCTGRTAQGYPTNGVSVAATLCKSWLGWSPQPTACWASTADHLGQGANGRERHPAPAEGRYALERATLGQRSWLVCGNRASHMAEVRPAAAPGRQLQVAPDPEFDSKLADIVCTSTRRGGPWCSAWMKSRRFRR